MHTMDANLGLSVAVAGHLGSTGLGVVIVVLCTVAGIGTVLLLPGRREVAVRKIGGVIVVAAGLIGGALLVRVAAHTVGDVYFWIFATVALLASIRVISHPKPVYSALYFVLTVLASAGLFVLLWAEFMAAALVLIYAGAILITYVFVIMLAQQSHHGQTGEVGGAEYDQVSREPVAAAAVGYVLMGLLLFVIFDKATQMAPPPVGRANEPLVLAPTTQLVIKPASAPAPAPEGSAQALAQYLFRDQVVSLEVAGLILAMAMVGAVIVARRRVVSETPVVGDEVAANAAMVDDDPHSIPVYGTTNPRAKEYPES